MNPDLERKKKIKELCDKALDIEAPARAVFLDRACGTDLGLRRDVESLLSHERSVAEFMARPAWQHVIREMARNQRPSLEDQRLGRYQIHERIGEGGMGEVWRATDQQLKRDVAIKILLPEFSSDVERVRRFEREAYAVSSLKHPNIITIHEIGLSDDFHFIVTELVEGRTLRDLMSTRRFSWREAVRIAAQIASALNAAHSAGIIHRDIKPENVIVEPGGHVKVLDFGIAKSIAAPTQNEFNESSGASVHTRFGLTPGTLKYMSPEQTRSEKLDSRSDVFSLGLVLYEMIFGTHPYAQMSEGEMAAALKSPDEIDSPTPDRRLLPSALSNIVSRSLRKHRADRYSSAGEMLAELEELRSMVEVSRQEKGEKLFRARHANELLTQFVVLYDSDSKARIPLGALWTIWRSADLRLGHLEREILRKSLLSGVAKIALLALVIAGVTMIAAAIMSVSEVWEEKVMRDGHAGAVRQAVFSPDGRVLVSVGEDAKVIVWDFTRRERLATLAGHSELLTSIAFSSNAKWIATGGHDRSVVVWDAVRLQKIAVLDANQDRVSALAFSPDSRMLASVTEKRHTIIWDTSRWEKIREVPINNDWGNLYFSSDSRWLLHSSGKIFDLTTGDKTEHENLGGTFAAISPDFKQRVTSDGEGNVKFVRLNRSTDLHQWKIIGEHPRAHQFHGRGVAFAPDGKLVATSANDIILWDADTQAKIARLSHTAEVWWLTFSPDGRWLVSTHADGAILLWDVLEREAVANLNKHHNSVRGVAVSPDGKRLASASEDRSIIIWNAETGKKEVVLNGHETRVTAVRFSLDARQVVSCDQSGFVRLWDLSSRQSRLSLGGNFVCYDLAISPDGRYISATSGVYDSADGRQVIDFRVLPIGMIYAVSFSGDGRWLAIATETGNLALLDTEKWQITESVRHSKGSPFTAMRFSADSKSLATGDVEGNVELWETNPLRQSAVLGRHAARVKSVAFSPDGREIITASEDQTIALWNVQSRRLVNRIGTHASPVLSAAFSPDGRRVISGEHDHSVRLYKRHRTLWGFRLD